MIHNATADELREEIIRRLGVLHEAGVIDLKALPVPGGGIANQGAARGPMFSARMRAKLAGEPRPAVVEEAELYDVASPQ